MSHEHSYVSLSQSGRKRGSFENKNLSSQVLEIRVSDDEAVKIQDPGKKMFFEYSCVDYLRDRKTDHKNGFPAMKESNSCGKVVSGARNTGFCLQSCTY